MANFVMVFPLTPLPLIAKSAKSMSHFNFFILPTARNKIVTTSASPLGLAEK